MDQNFNLEAEHELMMGVAKGSESATRKVTSDYLNYVITLAFRVVGNRHDAEEVAQEVFIKLFKQAENWEPRARISTWLYRVTYNAAIDCLRSRKRHTSYQLNEFITHQSQIEEDFPLEDVERLEEAMSQLPVQYRTALTVFYFQDKKTREAAEIMNLKEDAFESLLRRTRKKLRDILSQDNYRGKNEPQKNETNFFKENRDHDSQNNYRGKNEPKKDETTFFREGRDYDSQIPLFYRSGTI